MGRLFWKFLVAYWAAVLVAVISVGTAAWLYRLAEEEVDPSIEIGPRASFLVGRAEKKLRDEGLPALREMMEKWSRHPPLRLFAVDDQDRDLLGRPVPVEALRRARLLVEADERSRVVRLVPLADGGDCLLFVPVRAAPLWEQFLFAGRPLPARVTLTGGIFASLVFGALLAWYVARPIRHLREAFAALSRGRLDTRVAARIGRRRDEVADLGRDFDRMAEQIQTLIGAQRSLLHDVSHELRSPLARLQAAIGLARQNPGKLDSSLERIEREAVRLDELVGQLLTLSRLEAKVSGGAPESAERTDLADLVASIAEDARFEAQASERDLAFTFEGELPAEVRGELLHRAIENVVRNAVRHTEAGTTVEVDVRRSPSGAAALLSVADRGPGVADAELETIFEPFYRGGAGQAGSGFGLGLAIARRAVEAHGGRVRARNREGGGLVIEMSLPLAEE
jgi:two-component system OmpR family sensor kinase